MGLAITPADIDWLERRAARRREKVEETLWCEAGGHEWLLPRGPGRRPRSCPLHSETDGAARPGEWPGALPDCFLIDGRWAVRLFVDAPLLRGATWRVPAAVADGLAIETERSLGPERESLGQSLVLRGRARGLVADGLSTALQALDVMEGDFVFVRLQATSYDMIARRRREVVATDSLGKLLWGCGIEPNQDARAQPWLAIVRAIGGGEANREALRQRLIARNNFELVAALDETRRVRAATETDQPEWPPGWEFTARLDDDESRFALTSSSGTVLRVALGVLDADADGLITDATGVAWRELGLGETQDEEEHTPNERWIRWKRVEHHAVRAALAGESWTLTHSDGAWQLEGGGAYTDLADAFAAAAPSADATPQPPAIPLHATSPRSGFAYDRLVRRAIDRGLRTIEADPGVGLVAAFAGGERTEGYTLADLLAQTA